MDIELGKSVLFKPFHFETDKGIYLELSMYSLAELRKTDLYHEIKVQCFSLPVLS